MSHTHRLVLRETERTRTTEENPVIIELADFRTDDPDDFAAAMRELVEVVAASPGYLGHTVQRSIETPGRFMLAIRWESVEAHTEGFRKSDAYQTWTARVLPHRDGVVVEHFETVLTNRWDLDA
jgi:heme-degrading monooxygenase HmoA